MTLRYIFARISRALEALRDGERDLADGVLDDLAAEFWSSIEAADVGR